MLGVAIGILMGELALMVPESAMEVGALALTRMSGAVLCSILIASAFGLPAVVPIQAGVSAVLVLAMGPENAGWNRMEDVCVGAGVGLIFSQVLLTPDPLRQMESGMRNLLLRVGAGLDSAAEALRMSDLRRLETALGLMLRAQEDLALLRAGADTARYSARWSLRGRLSAGSVTAAADRSEHDAIRICAAALLLVDALREAILAGTPAPAGLETRIRALAAVSGGKSEVPLSGNDQPPDRALESEWMAVISPLHILAEILPASAGAGASQPGPRNPNTLTRPVKTKG